jgi:uncharacterized protein YdaU (DUF1376 family)
MKDPAFLFYPGDWMGGTLLLNRSQKGCYIDLLVAQFNNGPLSLEEIKTLLGSDFGQWPKIEKKFTFMDGRYYNQRLDDEIHKRAKFTSSRRSNASSSSVAKATKEHMEDVNENKDSYELPNWLNIKAWEAWVNYKKERKQKLTPSTVKLQLKFLEKNLQDHTEIIKQSISNGWTGFFPIKKDTQRKPNIYQEKDDKVETNERMILLQKQGRDLANKMKLP